MSSAIPPASTSSHGFVDTLRLGWRMTLLELSAIDEASSSRMGFLWPLCIVAIGGFLEAATNPLMAVFGPVGALIGFVVTVSYGHLVAQLLGGRGNFDAFTKAMGTASLPLWLGFVPWLGAIPRLYYLVIMVRVLMHLYGLSMGAALLIVVLPALLIVAGTFFIGFGVLSLGFLFG